MHHVDRAVVIGGGFIGLEMAENLVQRSIKVNLIERDEQIMPALDREMTAPVLEALEKNGVAVLLGDSVAAFEQTDVDIKVKTQSGRSIHADMVILAIGVAPDSSLARSAGLEHTERGHIVVNAITGKPCALPLAGLAPSRGPPTYRRAAITQGFERPLSNDARFVRTRLFRRRVWMDQGARCQ